MIKRTLDVLVSLACLILLAPLFIAISVAVVLSMGRPVFFIQVRPGLRGIPFSILKFRTMTMECGPDGSLLPDRDRLTCLGAVLRKLSLDELPQLLNVIRGELSLVGPRPLLMQYLDRYTPFQARRHDVRPGITGWAQVGGRNALSWEERFNLDVWYVDHQSLWLDLKILALTVWKVFARTGIAATGEATMPEFMGTRQSPRENG